MPRPKPNGTSTVQDSNTTNYWLYSPGSKGALWDECRSKGIMAIGWGDLGDLKTFASKEEIQKKRQERSNDKKSHKNDVLAAWEFANGIRKGDIVFAKKGRKKILGRGVVSSDYRYDLSGKDNFKHIRDVNWTNVGEFESEISVVKTLSKIKSKKYVNQLNALYHASDDNDELTETEAAAQEELVHYRNPFSYMLIASKNLIFRGAPGTGKTYLAKEIATDIISNGYLDDYARLTPEQKKQVELVQFHPSYDYSDFVEGLRPKVNEDGTLCFELQDGIFKKFVARARKNYEDSKKSKQTIEKEISVQESMSEFFSNIKLGVDTFKTINGNKFIITNVNEKHINIFIPENAIVNKLTLNLDEVRKMLESDHQFDKIKDITTFFGKSFNTQAYSYDLPIYQAIRKKKSATAKAKVKQEELKKYIFIIDEINRGDISKIFGELFFSIDPDYRGKKGEISTQYSNMHSDPDEKFYIPENVYIIGTMNDIDRSVDSFDFAMRRRFRFVKLRADERLEMLDSLENEELKNEAIKRMTSLNKEIAKVEDLNENYQIGASYFLKLKHLGFDQLWTDYLQPLLQEYIQGMNDEEGIMNRFAKAYRYQKPPEGNMNESTQDQG